jgi:DNA invertase Pin-like site-specific DNA recombinase
MTLDARRLVTPDHLRRLAIKYVRQSTLKQVRENTESAYRQYGLQGSIEALGWAPSNILTIDADQGHSGAFTAGRDGFQFLMSEVAMGRVGLVAALEVSRLCRDNADWAQLVKVCALTGTLLMDEQAVYDPRDRNDRMMLGFKGYISENERMMIQDRLRGAILSQAKRGVFRTVLPVGYVYDGERRVVLDPDQQVRQAILHVFETFRRVGSSHGTAHALLEEGVKIPSRVISGPRKGEVAWVDPVHHRVLQFLHNPRYAGTYVYGRRLSRHNAKGTEHRVVQPRDKWVACIPGAHPGYIGWEEFERNQHLIHANHWKTSKVLGGAVREGLALLQGLAVCGVCGRRMTIGYQKLSIGRIVPSYRCQGEYNERGVPFCQVIRGDGVDRAVGELLVEMVTPAAVAVAMEVHRELQVREEMTRRMRRQAVDRARYEAELAHRRYLHVDPENRLVADTLEKTWNEKLQVLARAEADYQAAEERLRSGSVGTEHAELRALPNDFATLWKDPRTPFREKKRMARLIMEDVTLVKAEAVTIQVRFKGGAARELSVPRPPGPQERRTDPRVLEEVRRLATELSDAEIATRCREKGYVDYAGRPVSKWTVRSLRRVFGIKGRWILAHPNWIQEHPNLQRGHRNFNVAPQVAHAEGTS